jgi:signal transduction histidine kinase
MNGWLAVKKFWNDILNNGSTNELPALDVIRLHVVNGAVVLLTLSQIVLIVLRLVLDPKYDLTILLNSLIALLAIPVLYLNKMRLYVAAKTVFYIGALTLITYIAYDHAINGTSTNTELILVACSIFSVLLFKGLIKYLSFIAIFGSYVFIIFIKMRTVDPVATLGRNELINPVLAFITVFVLTSLYLVAYNRSQRMVLEKNAELNRQKEHIESQSKKLQELNDQKDKLFSIISHDLRNPLNSLNGLLSLISRDYITEQDFKEQLPILSKNMIATSDLLNNLLHWSRSQMKGEVQNLQHFDIAETIKIVVQSVEMQAQEKGITIQNGLPSCEVYADMDMMSIVLRNLFVNAIKFSHAGQTVSISSQTALDHLQLCIKDSGIGIKRQELPRIFDFRFKSTDGTLHEKGTGLGLALCKEFVEKNNGKIWVESEEGKGTAFYFTIPVRS